MKWRRRYVKCDSCGRKIHEGDQAVFPKVYAGVYCSKMCWIREFGSNHITVEALTESSVDKADRGFEVES